MEHMLTENATKSENIIRFSIALSLDKRNE
jgi:hypothetical protein